MTRNHKEESTTYEHCAKDVSLANSPAGDDVCPESWDSFFNIIAEMTDTFPPRDQPKDFEKRTPLNGPCDDF